MPTADDILWFKRNFQTTITSALAGTPLDADMIVAIACQETGYIWSRLRKTSLSVSQIVALCVGDTIDYKGPGKGRQAFPKTRQVLEAEPNGPQMFTIARQALVEMAAYISDYQKAAANPDKFCHGFGIFQRDIQFFKNDPDYFLKRRYEQFPETLAQCVSELRRGLKKLGFEGRQHISDMEFAMVAIAYNTGGYNPTKGLKQGYFDGSKYYGELIYDYLQLSRGVGLGTSPVAGRYEVIARNGLKLRGGPGTNFESEKTLPLGSGLYVVKADERDPVWVQVDLEGDGLLDGYVNSSFLAPATVIGEMAVAEPSEDFG